MNDLINSNHTVVVLGASHKPERYSNQAVHRLRQQQYHVIPVHPKLKEIDGLQVVNSLDDIQVEVHTLTIYIGPLRSAALADSIVALHPGRVIFNPGSESLELEKRLSEHNIPFIRRCTLVMLQSGQF